MRLISLPFLRCFVGLLALGLLSGRITLAAETLTDAGRVVAVTVFQGQALVTREVTLPEAAGLVEAIVTGLPEQLLAGSLYAEPGQGVEVRSVRSRLRPVVSDDRAEVRQIEERLAALAEQRQELEAQKRLLTQRTVYLGKLEQFTADTSRGDLATGVLDAEALAQMTTLLFREREVVAERDVQLARRAKELDDEMALLARKRDTLTQGANRTSREAVVFLSKQKGATAVRLSYLVSGATWSPSYNLRAAEDRSRVTVEYNASVTQMSGEDWSDVAMILSTATPSLVATAPKLEPLSVRLIAEAVNQPARRSKAELFFEQKNLAINRGRVLSDGLMPAAESASAPVLAKSKVSGGFGGVYSNEQELSRFDSGLNSLGCELQLLDLSGRTSDRDRSPTQPEPASEGMSVVYRLANRMSLPSRSDKQLIPIVALPLEAEFYRVAAPVLTSYVYEEARLVNSTKSVLLAGPAATFLGDRFVGRGEVPSIAIGEGFTVGLGIDESLRASRELVDKSDRVQGGNRVARFDYRLTIDNFGDKPVEVRLSDRLPTSDTDAVKVTLVSAKPGMNTPGEPSVSEPTKEGFLNWVLGVAPGVGDDATLVEYTLQVEHDKNLKLSAGEK
ncbi:mucoidy inhibitor MuiA family protein [Botrimarina hoheduenensis]|uniref:DUF4139 domain-containing protein n=1 Tax=Botrimarina hoheduenensis TaxID=2528000 RepID=A0A5C5VYB9_9BACT|nr:mucoidy inhibitor MuiA family protein [Botrimarina hoheduenensis]TWT43410.1 hypothetical protein Pla111_23610 [Botrimarina hoheduenensis]